MSRHVKWQDVRPPERSPRSDVIEDEERITQFRELVYRLRVDAGLTQVELARRMGTSQSAIARIENGGGHPTLETLEKLARALGKDLVVGIGEDIFKNRTMTKLIREGHAVVRPES